MDKNKNKYKPICSRKDIGKLWSPISKDPANAIQHYASTPGKETQIEMIDLGAYCVMNNVNGEMLKLLVEYGNKFAERFKGMTEEDIKEFEEFKKFKLFQESKK
jgi:hypothetical protein